MDLRERRERLEKLADLEDIHVRAMYHRCLGKTVSEITNILELTNEGTVWDRFTKIFRKLEIAGEQELVSKYCPIFLEFIKSEDDLDHWGDIRAVIDAKRGNFRLNPNKNLRLNPPRARSQNCPRLTRKEVAQ